MMTFYDDEINDQHHQTMEMYKLMKLQRKREKKQFKQMQYQQSKQKENIEDQNEMMEEEINQMNQIEEEQVILVKKIIPKFMENQEGMMMKSHVIIPIKNKTSPFVKICKEGSETIRKHKEKKKRIKQTRQMLEDQNVSVTLEEEMKSKQKQSQQTMITEPIERKEDGKDSKTGHRIEFN